MNRRQITYLVNNSIIIPLGLFAFLIFILITISNDHMFSIQLELLHNYILRSLNINLRAAFYNAIIPYAILFPIHFFFVLINQLRISHTDLFKNTPSIIKRIISIISSAYSFLLRLIDIRDKEERTHIFHHYQLSFFLLTTFFLSICSFQFLIEQYGPLLVIIPLLFYLIISSIIAIILTFILGQFIYMIIGFSIPITFILILPVKLLSAGIDPQTADFGKNRKSKKELITWHEIFFSFLGWVILPIIITGLFILFGINSNSSFFVTVISSSIISIGLGIMKGIRLLLLKLIQTIYKKRATL